MHELLGFDECEWEAGSGEVPGQLEARVTAPNHLTKPMRAQNEIKWTNESSDTTMCTPSSCSGVGLLAPEPIF